MLKGMHTSEPPRYQEWLTHVFDHPVLNPAWFFGPDRCEFQASNLELVALLTYTFRHCGKDLKKYSDGQVNDGLNYIFQPDYLTCAVQADDVPLELRIKAIESIQYLYQDCFELRCAPVLSHLDEPGANPLNFICYMLWDITSLNYWEGTENKEIFYRSVLELHNICLGCKNIACSESTLHGLSHLYIHFGQEQIEKTVHQFIHDHRELRKELLRYAECAAVGGVE